MRRLSIPAGLAVLAAALVMVFTLNSYYVYVLANVALIAIVGVGLNVLIGLTGQISFGHVGFLPAVRAKKFYLQAAPRGPEKRGKVPEAALDSETVRHRLKTRSAQRADDRVRLNGHPENCVRKVV